MSNTIPLPDSEYGLAFFDEGGMHDAQKIGYSASDMRAHAAAVSAADNAALRAELAKHQESQFHPDWSMLEATRESLAEHQQIIRELNERVAAAEQASRWESDLCQQALERIKVLEDALHSIAWTRGPGPASKLVQTLESKALAALGDKP